MICTPNGKKYYLIIALLSFLIACGDKDPEVANKQAKINPQLVIPLDSMAVKMAESIMSRKPNTYGSWNYETATVLRGFEEVYKATGDERFYNYLKDTVDKVIGKTGSINGYKESSYNLDQIKEGSQLLYLYEKTGDERYKTAALALNKQLSNHPRTKEGGYWHKKKYPHQMWLDGLYMAEPFNVQYGALFDEPSHFDDVMLQFTLMETHTLDNVTGLLYHGWDESGNSSWADPMTHRSPEFWARAIGWYVMALVDVLDFMPKELKENRDTLIDILQRQIKAVEKFQDDDGVWWQILDKAEKSDNWQESSTTAMYVYAIAKGVRMGYLDSSHLNTAQKGWEGMNKVFIQENSNNTLTLKNTCVGTSVGASYSYYIKRGRASNDPKGLGPYLMAAVEMAKIKPSSTIK